MLQKRSTLNVDTATRLRKHSKLVKIVDISILNGREVSIKRESYKEAILKGGEILNLYYSKMLVELEKNADRLLYEFLIV